MEREGDGERRNGGDTERRSRDGDVGEGQKACLPERLSFNKLRHRTLPTWDLNRL